MGIECNVKFIKTTNRISSMKWITAPVVAALLMSGSVMAHVTGGHGQMQHGQMQHQMSDEQYAWGKMGNAKQVDREIVISMTDDMRFTPSEITVKANETVRFVVDNNGVLLHEIVIGTPDELQKHAVMMEKFPNMTHDEPYMAHVDPGKQGLVVWNFNRPGEFEFACLLPGHFQTGMKGKITVKE
jgi:uncharacterized cupredoxin-like copper-binding protein